MHTLSSWHHLSRSKRHSMFHCIHYPVGTTCPDLRGIQCFSAYIIQLAPPVPISEAFNVSVHTLSSWHHMSRSMRHSMFQRIHYPAGTTCPDLRGIQCFSAYIIQLAPHVPIYEAFNVSLHTLSSWHHLSRSKGHSMFQCIHYPVGTTF